MVKKLALRIKSTISATNWKQAFSFLFAVLILSLTIYLAYLGISQVWNEFILLDREISLGLLTAFTTVFVATLTLVIGKNYDRKKEIEAHYRQKKTEIYDDFLKEFFKIFHSHSDNNLANDSANLIEFLREWQRKIILWGGAEVVAKYVAWMENIKLGNPTAQTMFLTEGFFMAIRKDLGHSNANIPKGAFIRFMLRNTDLFLSMAAKNPNITLSEVAIIEELIDEK